MQYNKPSWIAFGLFYITLLLIILSLDWVNDLLQLRYVTAQIGLLSIGVAIFAVVGIWMPDLSAARGVLLAFTVGVLTIIPAVLMGLGRIPGFWPQYFYIAFGMAAGSFLSFLFLELSKRITQKRHVSLEIEHVNDTERKNQM
ncbi:MAG: hypothetical protein AAF485_18705 [Chloroflexota bacterium]